MGQLHKQDGITGFTLAELLISLLILGEIATFTIPKILSSQQASGNNAKAKEAIAMVAGAYQQYQLNQSPSAGTLDSDLTQYLNYVSVLASGDIDERPTVGGVSPCSSNCLLLHNGGVLKYWGYTFTGNSNLHALTFLFDPDGQYTGRQDSLKFYLYFNGRMSTRQNVAANTVVHGQVLQPSAGADPTWLSW